MLKIYHEYGRKIKVKLIEIEEVSPILESIDSHKIGKELYNAISFDRGSRLEYQLDLKTGEKKWRSYPQHLYSMYRDYICLINLEIDDEQSFEYYTLEEFFEKEAQIIIAKYRNEDKNNIIFLKNEVYVNEKNGIKIKFERNFKDKHDLMEKMKESCTEEQLGNIFANVCDLEIEYKYVEEQIKDIYNEISKERVKKTIEVVNVLEDKNNTVEKREKVEAEKKEKERNKVFQEQLESYMERKRIISEFKLEIKKDMEKNSVETIKKLFRNGADIEMVSKIIELSVEELKKLLIKN